jgi:hypothetical protein
VRISSFRQFFNGKSWRRILKNFDLLHLFTIFVAYAIVLKRRMIIFVGVLIYKAVLNEQMATQAKIEKAGMKY